MGLHEYGVKVISWMTDDGPNGKRMHRLLVLKQPKIIGTLCWGYQINLVFGKYISLPGVKEWIESVRHQSLCSLRPKVLTVPAAWHRIRIRRW